MPLPTPNLDDRRFQDILDEARRLIPRYCPEWTDHNLSDPGITLLELFAWMTDLLLYRLNRVPDRNYIKFLELIGVHLEPAKSAVAQLLFRLSAPQPDTIVIPRNTAVATVRSETREAINFATQRDLVVRVPQLEYLLASRDESRFNNYLPELESPLRPGIFSDPPRVNERLYFGFANDLSAHTLALNLDCPVEGVGVDPKHPPLVWEVYVEIERRWLPVEPEFDTTGGLNTTGLIILNLPIEASELDIDGKHAFWLRCSIVAARPRQPAYQRSPRIASVSVTSLGGTVPASHGFEVIGEELGATDGSPGQRVQLQTLPILPRSPGETLEVQSTTGDFEPWIEVSDFGASGPNDPHFILDDVTGTIELGPLIRTPAGEEHQYGRVPTPGRKLRFSRYRSGGGIIGNVGARTLTVMRSSIPYIASVTNPLSAVGGTDPEDIEHAKWRGPRLLRTSQRAVTAEDFEQLACAATPEVGRANCLVVRDAASATTPAGRVRLQLVPALNSGASVVPEEQLYVSPRVHQIVQDFLDERRLLASELSIERPVYVHVAVTARLRARARANRARVSELALEALYRYIHPTTGGPDGTGWPFERPLFVAEVYSLLQGIDGVDTVEDAALYQVAGQSGDRGRPLNRITPGSDGILCSAEHRVQFA
jgi:predicted phage baseplate assembly protein